MKTIQITGNTYLARVKGPSAKYGVEAEFLRASKQPSRKLAYYEVGPGIYKHEPREATVDSRRRDTGYLHISSLGDVREVDQAEAIQIAADLARAEAPEAARASAIRQIRDLMASHKIKLSDLQ